MFDTAKNQRLLRFSYKSTQKEKKYIYIYDMKCFLSLNHRKKIQMCQRNVLHINMFLFSELYNISPKKTHCYKLVQ